MFFFKKQVNKLPSFW